MRVAAIAVVVAAACSHDPVLNGFRSPMGVNGMRAQAHAGVDFAGEVGDPVLAAADGIVVAVTDDPVAGRSILVRHGTKRYTVYSHLAAVRVEVDQCVLRGQQIGDLGATGTGSGGRPHVHLQLCEYPCPIGTPDGDFVGVDDPLAHGAECFTTGKAYDDQTLTYPVVCDDAHPARPADPRACRARMYRNPLRW